MSCETDTTTNTVSLIRVVDGSILYIMPAVLIIQLIIVTELKGDIQREVLCEAVLPYWCIQRYFLPQFVWIADNIELITRAIAIDVRTACNGRCYRDSKIRIPLTDFLTRVLIDIGQTLARSGVDDEFILCVLAR